jgi:quercetin dioxygenase-like cupin family protein
MNPYNEQQLTSNIKLRSFDPKAVLNEDTWHRDTNKRVIVIIEGSGWKFQNEDQIPTALLPGDVLTIPAQSWHRIMPGKDQLVVLIKEIF